MSGIARPDGSYGAIAKIFHWVSVPLMLGAITTGFVVGYVRDSSKMDFYMIHESLGFTLLLVAIARIAWRRISPPPPLPGHLPPLMRRVARGAHLALYTVLILQPLLGFIGSNAWGFPMAGATAYLGFIDFPVFMPKNETLGTVLLAMHKYLGWTIVPLLGAHVAGAIYHHAIRRDGTLMRMI